MKYWYLVIKGYTEMDVLYTKSCIYKSITLNLIMADRHKVILNSIEINKENYDLLRKDGVPEL